MKIKNKMLKWRWFENKKKLPQYPKKVISLVVTYVFDKKTNQISRRATIKWTEKQTDIC